MMSVLCFSVLHYDIPVVCSTRNMQIFVGGIWFHTHTHGHFHEYYRTLVHYTGFCTIQRNLFTISGTCLKIYVSFYNYYSDHFLY